jgi:hypothetical protein
MADRRHRTSGALSALEDRCCHRHALSAGRREATTALRITACASTPPAAVEIRDRATG